MSMISPVKVTKNKHEVYRGEDCMKKLWECFKKHTRRIINIRKKKMKLLTSKQQEIYEKAKICYIWGKNFEDKYTNDNKSHKTRVHCYYTCQYKGGAHSICNLKYSILEEIIVDLYSGLNYDYHFNIKELTE